MLTERTEINIYANDCLKTDVPCIEFPRIPYSHCGDFKIFFEGVDWISTNESLQKSMGVLIYLFIYLEGGERGWEF